MNTSEEILTVEEVAAWLRVRESWVYSHADDLGVHRLGKYLRFSRDRVLQNLEKLGRQPNDLEQPTHNRLVILGREQTGHKLQLRMPAVESDQDCVVVRKKGAPR